ncbi:MAG: hypothetical protein H0T14_02980 [Nocardioidaceae bacterium]|nr:hypothetical protein [Nocardioidaceae bacterium]
MRVLAVGVAAAAITGLAVLAVTGSNRFSGPVLVELSDDHGIHRIDVVVAAVGAAAIAALVKLARRG